MAFKFISIDKIERENEYQPNYKVVIKYKEREIPCEIYTNAKIFFNGRLITDYLFNTSFNGNLYFRLEVTSSWHRDLEKKLQNEIMKFIRSQDKFKKRFF